MRYKLNSFCDLLRYNVPAFLRNVIVFRKVLWRYRSWDYYGMLGFMETSAKDMAKCHENHGHLVGSENTAKELRVFAEYMKRIRESDYLTRYIEVDWDLNERGAHNIKIKSIRYEGPKFGTKFYRKIEESCAKDDLQQAMNLFKRKVRTWWD